MEHFKELLKKSPVSARLSSDQKEALETAIRTYDAALLEKLYGMLLQEEAANRQIVSDFQSTQNKLVDNYMVAATEIRKKCVEAPMKEKIAETAQEEKAMAEAMLNKI